MRSDTRTWLAGLGLLALSLVVVACGGTEPVPTLSPTPAATPTPAEASASPDPLDATPGDQAASEVSGLVIRTILPRDAIPAILDPQFVSGTEAEAQMAAAELVIGLSINGDHRAYAIAQLSAHEVVNDVVGGRPVMVTW